VEPNNKDRILTAVSLVLGPLGVGLGAALGFYVGWIGGSVPGMIALGIASIFLAMLLAVIGRFVREFLGAMAVVYFAPILILGGAVLLICLVYALSYLAWAADSQDQAMTLPSTPADSLLAGRPGFAYGPTFNFQPEGKSKWRIHSMTRR
jgi:hypothetical protein